MFATVSIYIMGTLLHLWVSPLSYIVKLLRENAKFLRDSGKLLRENAKFLRDSGKLLREN
jgi:hypothetical protein